MEISAKILREVEFRDRLRGYDTDEVDEFLERIAIGIEELNQQVHQAVERAERAERQVAEVPSGDDDSIRRTLVLAQRTADLAIKEAEGEAERLLSAAQAQSESMLADASERASRTKSDAEDDLRERVERLGAERNRLEHDVATLVGLVESERGRLAESLRALLGYVTELDLSPELREVSARPTPFTPAPDPEPRPSESSASSFSDVLFGEPTDESMELDEELDLSFTMPDVERQVTEDAQRAIAPGTFGDQPLQELDPDEELWDRWARSGENNVTSTEDDSLGLQGNGKTDNWPA